MSNAQSVNSAPSNRLIGWLVSYELENQGKAFEIRAGRTLVSADSEGRSRLISINASGVSSPHLALSASPKHTVLVQDIFSDQGSYITKADSTDERPVRGAVELQHGDWLRIGPKTRLQLCLIDKPAR